MTVFMGGGNAFAANSLVACKDCYKCVRWSDTVGCLQCEYDENYCMGGLEPSCPSGKVWISAQNKCVCELLCVGEQDPDTCECFADELSCDSGQYVDGGGLLAKCVSCPVGDFNDPHTSSNPDLIPICGLKSENGGVDGKTNCFYQAISSWSIDGINYCDYSDNTGTFVWTQDCHYSE